jgi:hypothetical protein
MIKSTLRAAPNSLGNEFNPFLFGPMGTGRNSGQLSVVFSLARLDLDAWEEAASVARLPRDVVVGKLAALLCRLVFCVKDEDQAVALGNDFDFGLVGSVLTKDIARGQPVAARIETGMMFIDDVDWTDAALPFGGVKNSGYGRELGAKGIKQFVNKKLVRYVDLEASA